MPLVRRSHAAFAFAAALLVIVTAPSANAVPNAFTEFCAANPGDCQRRGAGTDPIAFAAANWADLVAVNARINRSVREVPDIELHGRADVWSLPTNNRGDCEDFVLAKRHALLRRGWPSSALLIAVVRDWGGEGHAVLLVPTARGLQVLDSRTNAIRPLLQTPYTFVLRQSAESPRRWVAMTPSRR